jgi:hypothetical protein
MLVPRKVKKKLAYVQSLFCFLFCADKHVTIQVTMKISEAQGANVIAAISVVSISVGTIVLMVSDAVALKTSVFLLVKNLREIAMF